VYISNAGVCTFSYAAAAAAACTAWWEIVEFHCTVRLTSLLAKAYNNYHTYSLEFGFYLIDLLFSVDPS